MRKWQPIATAPKDGTRVLLGRFEPDRHGREGTIAVDYWRTGERNDFTGWGKFNMMSWPPTHWMPLPDPPAKESDAKYGLGDAPQTHSPPQRNAAEEKTK